MKKNFLSLLLVLCLTVGLLPAVLGAAEPTTTPTDSTVSTTATEVTAAPTNAPSTEVTTAPTSESTSAPTSAPSSEATTAPTDAPTSAPTSTPTSTPTVKPTAPPTVKPTTPPTVEPSGVVNPTVSPVSISVKLCETSTNQSYLSVLTATKGGSAVYAVTNDAGIPVTVTNGSIPTDNYVKFEYPKNDIPTITFKGAYLRSYGNILDLSSFDIAVKIIIETDSKIESSAKNGILRESYGDITILGPGKLSMNCYSSAISFEGERYPNSLILKGLTLNATTSANVSARVFQIPAGNLIADQCTLTLTNQAGVAVFAGQGNVPDAANRGNIILQSTKITVTSKNTAFQATSNVSVIGSSVQLTSDARAISCSGNLTVDNATLAMTGKSGNLEALEVAGKFTIRGSIVEITGTKGPIFSSATRPELIGEFTVVAGADRTAATTYNAANAGSYQYFYAVPIGVLPTEPTTEPTTLPTNPAAPSTQPTTPFAEPTTSPTDAQKGTNATVSSDQSDNGSGNSVLFWILAVLMVLGACGAATMAILMLRRKN